MSNPRKASVSVKYNGKNIDRQIAEFITSFSYEDVASGESDCITLSLHNCLGKWDSSWFPKKGDKISADIVIENWKKTGDRTTFKCGNFTLDDLSFSGPPMQASIGAISVPAEEAFKCTKRTKTWKAITVQGIASEIAARSKTGLYYSGPSIAIQSLEQNDTTDCEFLYGLCESYGLAMKAFSNKIIIFDEADYESRKAVAIIDANDMESWSYNTTISGTYTGATISYTDPATEEDITVNVGSGSRILDVNEKADNRKDAELKACAKVNAANKKATTMSVTIMANIKIVASSNVEITGLGKMNGKYAVDKVKHSVGSKYTMQLDLHLIQKRITITPSNAAPENQGINTVLSSSYNVGDVVNFHGGTHYYSSYPNARGYSARAGKAKITQKNGSGKAHPWHLIHTDGNSDVYGWVDDGTFD